MADRCVYPSCESRAATGALCQYHGGSWRDCARCAGSPLTLWFSTGAADIAEARNTCADCPVRGACLADVLADEAGLPLSRRHGIRAGLDAAQRVVAGRQSSQMMADRRIRARK